MSATALGVERIMESSSILCLGTVPERLMRRGSRGSLKTS